MKKNILALDIGYGNTKLVFSHDGNDNWGEMVFKSVVPKIIAHRPDQLKNISGSLDRVVIEVDGAHYLVGPEAHVSGGGPTLSQEYIHRPEYLALIKGSLYYAMQKTGLPFSELDTLVLGLPVSNWQNKKAELSKLGAGPFEIEMPSSLRGMRYGDKATVAVNNVIVLPQPMGGLEYAGNFEDGLDLDDDSVHMVIDPGYNTFDWFVSVGFKPDLQRSGSLPGGVSQLLKAVAIAAGRSTGLGALNLVDVETGLQKGVLRVHGQKIDMQQFEPLMAHVAEQVVEKFMNAIDGSKGVDSIIVVGGSAAYYIDALKKAFRGYDLRLVKNSVMANARGFYLMGEAASGV